MKILVTGANGYIGQRLIPSLLEQGHHVIAMVRDARRFSLGPYQKRAFELVEADLLKPETLSSIPDDIQAAYYLVHSMGQSEARFAEFEAQCAGNFVARVKQTQVKQFIYLGGISNDQDLSTHLKSRMNVGAILAESGIPCTNLRAAIIIGSGSASFEIIRDLVEKLPIMITPKWLKTRCQPIAIRDVIFYLTQVLDHPESLNRTFDIGGPDVLSYRDMLLEYARVRGLKRFIISLPVLTPRLSSHWLFFITSTSLPLARSLVDSMKNEVVCGEETLQSIIPHTCMTYSEALKKALANIENNQVLSSWKDAVVSGTLRSDYLDIVHIPTKGVLQDIRVAKIEGDVEDVRNRVWSIGGSNGWYAMNWAWKLRGLLDKMMGGVGLRRGRRVQNDLKIGDPLDFWRVVLTDEAKNRLSLRAEMKVPGEAWLEWEIQQQSDGPYLKQTATFRPKGVLGRLYWYSLVPCHFFVFRGMIHKLVAPKP